MENYTQKKILCSILYDDLIETEEVSLLDFFDLLYLLDESIKNTGKASNCNANEQCEYLKRQLERMPDCEAKGIAECWEYLRGLVSKVEWYDQMHEMHGGIIARGDDSFYIDFADWLTSRGTEFLIGYFRYGKEFVFNYIEDYDIPGSEFLFEGITYVFSEYIEHD